MQATNLQNAKNQLEGNSKDLDIMKDFSTTTEVSLQEFVVHASGFMIPYRPHFLHENPRTQLYFVLIACMCCPGQHCTCLQL
jgi:hypothetical protein